MSKSSNTDDLGKQNHFIDQICWYLTSLGTIHIYFSNVSFICVKSHLWRIQSFTPHVLSWITQKFLSELSIQDLHPLNLNLELVVTNEILTRFLQEFLQCAAVTDLPFGFMFLHRAALLRSSSRSCKNGSVEASGLHVPTYIHQFALNSTWPLPQSGFTFFSENLFF